MRTDRITWLLIGLILGVMIGVMIVTTVRPGQGQPTLEQAQRDYDAYRECIPKPGCMTDEGYLHYYNLKWQLEQEQ